MTELTDFLLARIAEDERAARDVRPGTRTVRTNAPDVERYLTVWHPDRALAECEAKRRIVEAAREQLAKPGDDPDDGMADLTYESVLEMLALPHADHPDYLDEWKP